MKYVLALLTPHLETAKRVQFKLAEARVVHLALAAGLDRSAAAAFILDSTGAVLHLNSAAEAILSTVIGIRVRHGKLSFAEPGLNSAIEAAVRSATQTAPRWTLLPLGKGSAETAELMVSPLHPRHELVTSWQAPLALLVITEPRCDSESIAQRVRVLYGLTAAEARVMAAIALGADVEEITQTFGVKRANGARAVAKHLRQDRCDQAIRPRSPRARWRAASGRPRNLRTSAMRTWRGCSNLVFVNPNQQL